MNDKMEQDSITANGCAEVSCFWASRPVQTTHRQDLLHRVQILTQLAVSQLQQSVWAYLCSSSFFMYAITAWSCASQPLSMYARLCDRALRDPDGDWGGRDWLLPICCALREAHTASLHSRVWEVRHYILPVGHAWHKPTCFAGQEYGSDIRT